MITTLRRSTIALLASSLLLTIGRGATLPFMTIYLTRRFQLEVDVIGYALSLALVVCVLLAVLNRFTNPQYYWSGWVALIWGALLVVRGLRLFVFGEWIKNWRQARLQRLLRK